MELKKIKILYIVSTLEQKGPTNQLFYIVNNLDESVFDCMILTLSQEPKQSYKERFEDAGIKVKCLNTGRISGFFKNNDLIKKIVKSYMPNIIHTQGIRADGYAANLSNKYPAIVTARNFPWSDYPAKFGKVKGNLMANGHIRSYRKLNVVACSHSIQKDLKTINVKSLVVQNGVDIDRYFPISVDEKLKQKTLLGIKAEQRVYLTVGSLISRKNVEVQVEAFNKLNDHRSILVVLGDGSEREELKQKVTGKNVFFVGQVKNVKKYLQIAYCFISSSFSEGLPNAVMEALACGLPVILSDILPHHELIEQTLYEKFLFDASSSEELLERIKVMELTESQWDEMSKESRKIVEEKFTHKKMSSQYQTIYKNLVENNGFQL